MQLVQTIIKSGKESWWGLAGLIRFRPSPSYDCSTAQCIPHDFSKTMIASPMRTPYRDT
ncbi:hypothetical protein ALP8811_02205 [Aliiroseovarius pelagivivens]|uniref:Uncharacterized protein n=1 Tax=Aliiroseovarius pelagivivens TaxID=1639690 RepID=A0A2R8AMA1_9RHOB|nr:hypothetical protein ALP8811_02205 [Aliiroseovarius pelagivivens]